MPPDELSTRGAITPRRLRPRRPLIAKGRTWRHGWHLFTSWLGIPTCEHCGCDPAYHEANDGCF